MTHISQDDSDSSFAPTVASSEQVHDPGSYPSQGLTFINSTSSNRRSDPATRTLVKKHVMHDIGKARRKGSSNRRKKAVTFPLALVPDASRASGEDIRSCTHQISSTNLLATSQELVSRTLIPRSPSASVLDPFQYFPIPMNRRRHELLANVFDDARGGQRAFRENWYVVGLADPASFYDVLSNSAINAAKLLNDKSAEKDMLWFHSQALQSVHDRLSDSEQATGEGILGTVTGLICHAGIRGDWTRWRTHMDGIQRIINLRGGIETLYHNKELMWTIYWVDISAAASQDIPPTFPFPYELPQLPVNNASLYHGLRELSKIRSTCCVDSEVWQLIDVFADFLDRLRRDVANDGPRTWERTDYMYTDLLPLLHRLLWQQKKTESCEQILLAELLRLGMLLCLSQLRRDFGVHPVYSGVPVAKLRNCISRNQDSNAHFLEPIFSWVLVMGLIEAVDVGTREWYLGQIESNVLSGSPAIPATKPEIVRSVSQFLWLDASHGPLLHAILEDRARNSKFYS